MTGLEKIIQKINSDSEKECASIVAKARADAEKLLADADAAREKMSAEIIATAQSDADEMSRRGRAAAQQIERQTLLKYRVRAIDTVLGEAVGQMKSAATSEYFDMLKALAVSNARNGKGIMRLSSKDRQAMPSDFITNINSIIGSGKEIVLSDEAADTDGGFVLVYGDIYVNCTFDALADEHRDELREEICSIIF